MEFHWYLPRWARAQKTPEMNELEPDTKILIIWALSSEKQNKVRVCVLFNENGFSPSKSNFRGSDFDFAVLYFDMIMFFYYGQKWWWVPLLRCARAQKTPEMSELEPDKKTLKIWAHNFEKQKT